jgi:NAD+ diphosphatase
VEIKFCRRCGAGLTQKGVGRYICTNNHELFYKTSGVAVGLLLVDQTNRALLSVRGIDPGKGKLDIPGGFVEFGETLEQAVAREIKEELTLEAGQYGDPQYLLSSMNEYPYDGEVLYPYDVFFWTRISVGATITPQDDVADAKWFKLETLNPEDFAFDTSRRALKLLKQKLI